MELILGNNTHVENPSLDILKPVALDEITITLTNGSNVTESFQFQVPRSRGRLTFMSRGGGEEIYNLVLDRIGFAIGNEKQPLHYKESLILLEYGQNHFLRVRPHLFIVARSEPNRPSIDVSGWCEDVEFVEKESYKIKTLDHIQARIESVKLVNTEDQNERVTTIDPRFTFQGTIDVFNCPGLHDYVATLMHKVIDPDKGTPEDYKNLKVTIQIGDQKITGAHVNMLGEIDNEGHYSLSFH